MKKILKKDMKKSTVIDRYNKWIKKNGIKEGALVQVFSTDKVFIVSKMGTTIYGDMLFVEEKKIIKK